MEFGLQHLPALAGCRPARIDAILEALQLKLNEEGLIDFDLWCLDGSNVRASKDAAGARKKTPQ
jgi:hypothetical protein